MRGIVARASKSGIGGRAGRKRIYQSGLKETKTGGRHEGIYMPAMPRREAKVQALLSNRYCRVCYPYVKAEKAKRAEQQGKRR